MSPSVAKQLPLRPSKACLVAEAMGVPMEPLGDSRWSSARMRLMKESH